MRGLAALGHAALALTVLPSASLRFERDDYPFQRHGDLVGWPMDRGPEAKAVRKSMAIRLSGAARLVLYGLEETRPLD